MLPDNKAGTLLSLCPEDRAKVQRIVQQVMNCFLAKFIPAPYQSFITIQSVAAPWCAGGRVAAGARYAETAPTGGDWFECDIMFSTI